MNRRTFLAALTTITPLLYARLSSAQSSTTSVLPALEDLRRLINDSMEVERILEQVDAAWAISALAFSRKLGKPPPIDARQAYLSYRIQIAAVDPRKQTIEALSSTEAVDSLLFAVSILTPILPKLRGQLREAGVQSDWLVDELVRGFGVFSQLLIVKSKTNDHWWCHCYGLGGLLCG